jgi:hypothetical protein
MPPVALSDTGLHWVGVPNGCSEGGTDVVGPDTNMPDFRLARNRSPGLQVAICDIDAGPNQPDRDIDSLSRNSGHPDKAL